MPTLTKLELEEGKDSMLPTGYSSTLPLMKLVNYTESTDPKHDKIIDSIQEIEVGKQLILYSLRDYHRTSLISEIVSKDKGRVVFKTQTSVYELTGE